MTIYDRKATVKTEQDLETIKLGITSLLAKILVSGLSLILNKLKSQKIICLRNRKSCTIKSCQWTSPLAVPVRGSYCSYISSATASDVYKTVITQAHR